MSKNPTEEPKKNPKEDPKATKAADPRRLPFTARDAWRLRRYDMERREVKSHPRLLRPRRWNLLGKLLKLVAFFLRVTGLTGLARRKALDIELNRLEVFFPALPKAFDGYTILHITDPHFDMVPEVVASVLAILPREEVDLAVLTGDYREKIAGKYRQILDPMDRLCRGIRAREGILVTLGNHDTVEMVADFEAMGLRVLVNETVTFKRGESTIAVTGLDDVHYYYTEQATEALSTPTEEFKIALVHSNEIAGEAAALGYSFYLSGHTHGGQVCLPNGYPVLTHTDTPRSMAKGLWRVGELLGYTSPGAGVVGLPLRLFSRGEIVLFTLRRGSRGV